MAGHSKFANIKHRKGAQDAKRGKIFTKHAKLIAIAARAGADISMNPALKSAIENAKSDNVPNDNIDRAIKKGSGEGKDATQYFEVTYEAYGPGGIAMIIDGLTDNKNRTVTNVRTILGKNGGNIAESGSVSWMFDKKGEIKVDLEGKDLEEFELFILESGAEDFEIVEDGKLAIVFSSLSDFGIVKNNILEAGYSLDGASLAWIPNQKMKIDNEKIEKFHKLIELIEEDDDVHDIYTNIEY